MKSIFIKSLVLFIALLFTVSNARAQDTKGTDNRIVSFVNHYSFQVSLIDGNKVGPFIFWLKYTGETKEYKFYIDGDTTNAVKLLTPLNFSEFHIQLDKMLHDSKGIDTSSTFSSSNEIFRWVYLSTFSDDAPESGTLYLHKYVTVTTDEPELSNAWNYEARTINRNDLEAKRDGAIATKEKLVTETKQKATAILKNIVSNDITMKLISGLNTSDSVLQDTAKIQSLVNTLVNVKDSVKVDSMRSDKFVETYFKRFRERIKDTADLLERFYIFVDQKIIPDNITEYQRNKIRMGDNNMAVTADTFRTSSSRRTYFKVVRKDDNSFYVDGQILYYNDSVILDYVDVAHRRDDNVKYVLKYRRNASSDEFAYFEIRRLEKSTNILLKINPNSTLSVDSSQRKIIGELKTLLDTLANENKKRDQAVLDANKKLIATKNYQVKDIQFQFERGFLENVQVKVEVDGVDQIFENIYAMGFSSKSDYKRLTQTVLYIRNDPTPGTQSKHIFLADVIQNYDNLLQNFTRDFSPADTSFRIDPSRQSQMILHKDKLVNLFEGKAYTDLIGIDNKKPNGLLQIEFARRFNLLTVRKQAGKKSDYGYFNYMNVAVAVTKIENNERALTLRNNNTLSFNNELASPSYATNLDIQRYQNFALKMETNAFLYDYPDGKFTFYADLGFKYGLTPVKDSLRTYDTTTVALAKGNPRDFEAHTFTLYPKFTLEFFSERRYGFQVSYQYQYTWLFSNNQFKQVASYEKFPSELGSPITSKFAHQSHVLEFYFRIEPNPNDNNGKLFFRSRFYLQQGDVNTFFPQIQLGYSYNFVFKSVKK